MSKVLENIKSRRSIRKYRPDMLPREVIETIAEAGSYAASGMNRQSPIIVAVTNRQVRDRLAEANCKIGGWKEGFDPFYGAPVILIVLADKSVGTALYDGSLVMGNLMLAAHDLGIGSCWIHRAQETFELPEWKEWLHSIGVEGDYEGIGHVALGYVEGDYPSPLPRKTGRIFFAD